MNINFPCHSHSPPGADTSEMESTVAHGSRISPMTSPTHQRAAAVQGKEAGTPHSARWQLLRAGSLQQRTDLAVSQLIGLLKKYQRGQQNSSLVGEMQTASLLNHASFPSSKRTTFQWRNPLQRCQSVTLDWEHNPVAKPLLRVFWICWRDLAHSST